MTLLMVVTCQQSQEDDRTDVLCVWVSLTVGLFVVIVVATG